MKIFIFSESEQALALRDSEKAAGNQAFIRNPQYFNPVDFDASADKVYTDDPAIAEVFAKLGKQTAALAPKAQPKAEPKAETTGEAPAPAAKKSVKRK